MVTFNPPFRCPDQAHDNKTLLELVPFEVALAIFKKCSLGDMVNCSEVSKGLNALASDDTIWKPTAQLLEIRVEELFYPFEPAETSGFKVAVGARVLELKACIAEADPVLDAKVKTSLEFGVEMLKGANREKLQKELDQKHQLRACLDTGMRAHLFLRRIGMSTFPKMEQYAAVLEEKYGHCKNWDFIAKEHVREGDFEKAIEVIDAHLNSAHETSERNNLFYSIVSHFSQAGDFISAIAYLKKLRSYQRWDPQDRECPTIVLAHAKEKRNFAVVLEMLTEDVIPQNERISNIIQLIDVYIEERKYQKARDLVQQFAAEMDENSNEYQIHELIRIYVQLGQNQKAWDLANRHREDNLIFAVLRNAFTDKGLLGEAKKAEALIKV
jgi:tetratricopeptide (TPR) repeat protein